MRKNESVVSVVLLPMAPPQCSVSFKELSKDTGNTSPFFGLLYGLSKTLERSKGRICDSPHSPSLPRSRPGLRPRTAQLKGRGGARKRRHGEGVRTEVLGLSGSPILSVHSHPPPPPPNRGDKVEIPTVSTRRNWLSDDLEHKPAHSEPETSHIPLSLNPFRFPFPQPLCRNPLTRSTDRQTGGARRPMKSPDRPMDREGLRESKTSPQASERTEGRR